MQNQVSKRAGIKLRRAPKKATRYAAQYYRTRKNKIRRLMRRLEFDPTAEAAIHRLESQPIGARGK